MAEAPATYAPLDRPKPVADDLWIVDSGPHRVWGIPIPVRMTVIRLPGDKLLLHSPTRFTPQLHDELLALGRVSHLVAPNSVHWSYLGDWQRACPKAATWGAPALRRRLPVRRSQTRIDHDLAETPPAEWAEEIDQTIVPGGGGFREVVFLHRKTRTLVLTDLVVNVRREDLPPLARQGAWLVGSTAPEGKAPLYVRAIVRMKGEAARKAGRRLLAWRPERVIFSHGDWYQTHGARRLAKALDWLVD